MPLLQESEALEELEGLQDPVAAGPLVELGEKEVQEEQEAKVGMVVILASAMLRRGCGQHTRTGTNRVIVIIFALDVTRTLSLIPVPTLLLVLLENV